MINFMTLQRVDHNDTTYFMMTAVGCGLLFFVPLSSFAGFSLVSGAFDAALLTFEGACALVGPALIWAWMTAKWSVAFVRQFILTMSRFLYRVGLATRGQLREARKGTVRHFGIVSTCESLYALLCGLVVGLVTAPTLAVVAGLMYASDNPMTALAVMIFGAPLALRYAQRTVSWVRFALACPRYYRTACGLGDGYGRVVASLFETSPVR